jgi:hypothetical protein
MAALQKIIGAVAANKASAAGDEEFHDCPC